MLLIKTTLKPSSIHGIGLFADQVIRKDEVVWRFEPMIDIRLTPREIETLPKGSREQILKYSYRERGRRLYVLCGDDARFFNHSNTPNCIDIIDGTNITFARWDIKSGEELTCNYALFDRDYPEESDCAASDSPLNPQATGRTKSAEASAAFR